MAKTNYRKIINMFAFIGLCFVAFALFLGFILSKVGVEMSVVDIIYQVGEWMAYLVTAIYAGFYVSTKRSMLWWAIYAVALVIIIILLFLR